MPGGGGVKTTMGLLCALAAACADPADEYRDALPSARMVRATLPAVAKPGARLWAVGVGLARAADGGLDWVEDTVGALAAEEPMAVTDERAVWGPAVRGTAAWRLTVERDVAPGVLDFRL